MVARVTPSQSIRNIFHYNENKLDQIIDEEKGIKAATLIHASGFAKDTEELTRKDRIKSLEKLTSLNQRTKYNAVHISLNFHPSEKDMPREKLRGIVDAYMEKIGFGHQPYLVYEHKDADHPHVHIVTTNIQRNGKAINLHNIGKHRSEPARQQIEKDFNLVVAQSEQLQETYELKPINVAKITVGKHQQTGLKRAISNVLDHVLPNYVYSSLPELNAVLRQYNVQADQGSKDSRIFRNNGLVYRAINETGEPTGVPIPASHIYSKPTMAVLQENFLRNKPLKQPHKLRVKNAFDMAFSRQPGLSIDELTTALRKERIVLVARINDSGRLYGVTYVDTEKKCVFKGSDLGPNYKANDIHRRCGMSLPVVSEQQQQPAPLQQTAHSPHTLPSSPAKPSTSRPVPDHTNTSPSISLPTSTDHSPAATAAELPSELLMDTKKKKRKKKQKM